MRRSLQNALGNGALSNDMPLAKRVHVHYEKNAVSNSSFLNDEKYCDITFCVEMNEQRQNSESQEQDADVETNGILLVCLLLKLCYFCLTNN